MPRTAAALLRGDFNGAANRDCNGRVYSDADKDPPHVEMADEAVRIET